MKCSVCQNEDTATQKFYTVKEMMFGTGETFQYMQCAQCGLLQICEIPAEMSQYYPKDKYYSLGANGLGERLKKHLSVQGYRNAIATKRIKNPLGVLRALLQPLPIHLSLFEALPHENILDIGCGCGMLLDVLASVGYRNLQGVDPFIACDVTKNNGVKLKKGSVYDIQDRYHLIMMHHSLEHMADHLSVLKKIAQLLHPNGICMIRIPVVNHAWERYREHWVQIDAPRHFYLHTQNSFGVLAKQANLHISKVVYDSVGGQFISSELYQKGIPLWKQTFRTQWREIGLAKIRAYHREAKQLNAAHKGDQAVFLLVPAIPP